MEADWYVDPLGRYEGRYFDGQAWTDQVSADGALAADPDWPPTEHEPVVEAVEPVGAAPAEPVVEAVEPVGAVAEPVGVAAEPVVESIEPVGLAAEPVVESIAESVEHPPVSAPAVAPIERSTPRRASLTAESPARAVAVLDDRVIASDSRRPSSSVRWLYGVGLVAVLAALALFVVPQLGGDDADQADDVTDPTLPDDIEELDVDEPAGVVDTGERFDAAEATEVGDSVIANGSSVLSELAEWHKTFAGQRGVVLDDTAGCWFARLGNGTSNNAYCGPVGASEASDFLYDEVPLRISGADGAQVAEPVLGAATADVPLRDSLELVASPDGPPPPQGVKRGERAGG